MKFFVLSHDATLYSTRRLLEAGQVLGHEMVALDPFACFAQLDGDGLTIAGVAKGDGVLPRVGTRGRETSLAILAQFEAMGYAALNSGEAIALAGNKVCSLQRLQKAGLPIPKTIFSSFAADREQVIAYVGLPLVIKVLHGSQGRGVMLAETARAAYGLFDFLAENKVEYLVQEFVSAAGGHDMRVFVCHGEVYGAYERRARAGEFRANMHRGGDGVSVPVDQKVRSLAVQSVQAMGLDYGGVDVMMGPLGPLLLEVNAAPGLEGAERVLGKDLALPLLQRLEQKVVTQES